MPKRGKVSRPRLIPGPLPYICSCCTSMERNSYHLKHSHNLSRRNPVKAEVGRSARAESPTDNSPGQRPGLIVKKNFKPCRAKEVFKPPTTHTDQQAQSSH